MRSSDTTRVPLTRRAVLGRTAGAAAGIAAATGIAAGSQSAVAAPTVMTQNAYLGFDVAALAQAESMADVRRIAGKLFEQVEPERYGARADSFAAAVETNDPAVVALQEVVALRRQQPGDFGTEASEPASEVVVDFLSRIRTALDERGLDYTVAAETVTNDIELPAETDDGAVDVRLTDRDVVLVRGDLDTADAVTGTYDAALALPVPGTDRRLVVNRGYAMVDVTVDGVEFTAVSTHLESTSATFRRLQARELLDILPADGPVVLGGDINSTPGSGAYELLTDTLTDPYAELRPEADGYTCCQADDLRNDQSQLTRRIDTVLYRGAVSPTSVGRVGHEPGDRVAVAVDGETVRVWPSDHAGVVTTLEISSTSAETATPSTAGTPSPTASGTPSAPTATGVSAPGFGLLSAVAGLVLGVGTWLRRRSD